METAIFIIAIFGLLLFIFNIWDTKRVTKLDKKVDRIHESLVNFKSYHRDREGHLIHLINKPKLSETRQLSIMSSQYGRRLTVYLQSKDNESKVLETSGIIHSDVYKEMVHNLDQAIKQGRIVIFHIKKSPSGVER